MALSLLSRRITTSASPALIRLFSLSSAAPAPATLFVGSLNFDTSSSGLAENFKERTGSNIISSRVIQDRLTGRSKGFGYVEFENSEDAERAIEQVQQAGEGDPFLIDGFRIRVDHATSLDNSRSSTRPQFGNRNNDDRGSSRGGNNLRSFMNGEDSGRPARQENTPNPSLYIGNIPYTLSTEEIESGLASLFPDVTISEVHVITSRMEEMEGLPEDAKHRGFAFVRLGHTGEATDVLEKIREFTSSGKEVLGTDQLKVDFRARSKNFDSSRSPQRGGGRSGGFDGGDRRRGGRGGGNFGGRSGGNFNRGGRGSSGYGEDF